MFTFMNTTECDQPESSVADTACGSASNLHFLLDEMAVELLVPGIDKSKRGDGTYSQDDLTTTTCVIAAHAPTITSCRPACCQWLG